MLNDRDDKFEGHEDSEYHFSDEEVSYEVESPKAAPVGESKESVLNRLTRSKRMLISIGVFFVLVLVAYKMVAPATSTPGTDITPPVVAQQNMTSNHSVVANVKTPAVPPVMAVAPVLPVSGPSQENLQNTAMAAPMNQPVSQPVASVPSSPQQQMAQQQPQMQQPQQMPMQQMQQPPSQQMQQPQSQSQPQQMPQQQVASMPSMTQPVSSSPTMQQSVQQPSSALTVVTGMPPVMPVQPQASPNGYAGQQQPVNAPPANSMNSTEANLAMENEKLIGQLQSDVTQKINDYQSQNKNVLDQVQVLNSRIAGMETQMTQLVQALSHQNQGQAGAVANINTSSAQAPPQQGSDPKIAYNVQAIIPGRAWLRSDSGETVTVAEGDVVKELGRVTKIDPYDGVVEINTGSKVVSLSYGNGG